MQELAEPLSPENPSTGQQRATEVYAWRHIIERYEALWEQLNHIRQAQATGLKALAHPWPARMDPFHTFSAYPTHSLSGQTCLELATANKEDALARVASYKELAMVNYAEFVLPTEEEILAVIEAIEPGVVTVLDLVAAIPEKRQTMVMRALSWLVKLGVLRLVK